MPERFDDDADEALCRSEIEALGKAAAARPQAGWGVRDTQRGSSGPPIGRAKGCTANSDAASYRFCWRRQATSFLFVERMPNRGVPKYRYVFVRNASRPPLVASHIARTSPRHTAPLRPSKAFHRPSETFWGLQTRSKAFPGRASNFQGRPRRLKSNSPSIASTVGRRGHTRRPLLAGRLGEGKTSSAPVARNEARRAR